MKTALELIDELRAAAESRKVAAGPYERYHEGDLKTLDLLAAEVQRLLAESSRKFNPENQADTPQEFA